MTDLASLTGARVLVTGGTGSFGTHFARAALDAGAAEIALLSRDEQKHQRLRVLLRDERVRSVIADVRDLVAMLDAFTDIDVVVHGAALKHVDLCERFPEETVKTNVLGAANVLRAARERGVGTVVNLSADKSLYPIGVYGASKLLAELMFGSERRVRSLNLRYGNVISSAGSVFPLFVERLRRGLPLTVTDERMERVFVTQSRALEVLELALRIGEGGETFVPTPLRVRIVDLARRLVHRLAPDVDPNELIEVGTPREGEKLSAHVLAPHEVPRTVIVEDCLVVAPAERAATLRERYPAASEPLDSESLPLAGDEKLDELIEAGLRESEAA